MSSGLHYLALIAAVVAMAMPRMRQARLIMAVAAAAGCAGMISEREYGFAAAFAVLFVVSLAPFLTELMGRGKLKFSEEESGFRAAHLDTLPGRDVRLLLDQGNWLNLQPGEVLTREGEAVSGVFFLAEGSAAVTVGGADVGTIDKGNLIRSEEHTSELQSH